MALVPDYDGNVFINCPFDAAYTPMFEAIVFTIQAIGLRPKSARQRLDSSEIRLHKIIRLIGESRFSIHDLSRTELDDTSGLPRFNMPLELGVDLGCKAFGPEHARKSLLIFDSEPHRFQKSISDISGQDVHQHGNDPAVAVARVRDWLRAESDLDTIPGGPALYRQYLTFREDLPTVCAGLNLDLNELHFVDFSFAVMKWLRRNV
jgi:hypothetical protein